jgi:hypothetical protein
LRVTVGERAAKEGKVELRYRKTGEATKIDRGEALPKIIEAVKMEKQKLTV